MNITLVLAGLLVISVLGGGLALKIEKDWRHAAERGLASCQTMLAGANARVDAEDQVRNTPDPDRELRERWGR